MNKHVSPKPKSKEIIAKGSYVRQPKNVNKPKKKIEDWERKFDYNCMTGIKDGGWFDVGEWQPDRQRIKQFIKILLQEKEKEIEEILIDYMKKICWSKKDIDYLLRALKPKK